MFHFSRLPVNEATCANEVLIIYSSLEPSDVEKDGDRAAGHGPFPSVFIWLSIFILILFLLGIFFFFT